MYILSGCLYGGVSLTTKSLRFYLKSMLIDRNIVVLDCFTRIVKNIVKNPHIFLPNIDFFSNVIFDRWDIVSSRKNDIVLCNRSILDCIAIYTINGIISLDEAKDFIKRNNILDNIKYIFYLSIPSKDIINKYYNNSIKINMNEYYNFSTKYTKTIAKLAEDSNILVVSNPYMNKYSLQEISKIIYESEKSTIERYVTYYM